eukprot:3420789-Karenia_brevis.AAC.1
MSQARQLHMLCNASAPAGLSSSRASAGACRQQSKSKLQANSNSRDVSRNHCLFSSKRSGRHKISRKPSPAPMPGLKRQNGRFQTD